MSEGKDSNKGVQEKGKLQQFHDSAKWTCIGSTIATVLMSFILSSTFSQFSETLLDSLTRFTYYTDLSSSSQGVAFCSALVLICASVAFISGFFWVACNLLTAYKSDDKD